jgi:TolA-binding protein
MKYFSALIIIIFLASCQSEKEKLAKEIMEGESKLFNDSVKALNVKESEKVLKGYLQYADNYKDDTASANYLFKAGDLSQGMHHPEEAIAIYERLRVSYPDYRKSAAALFMQGFIYETALADKEKAKEKYAEFLAKYPEHKLAPSAKASLDQLNANLSDEELIKMFEKAQTQ